MLARDGPEMTAAPLVVIEPEMTPTKAPASRSKTAPKPKTDTGIKRAPKSVKKPPTVRGYSWKSDSSGFSVRKTVYVTNPDTGIKKRKLQRVGHLSKTVFDDMKQSYKGKALERRLREWIAEAEHDR